MADVWLIEEALKRQSLACEIEHYSTAEDAIHAVRKCGHGNPIPDLMLLDYNLPRGHGCDILVAAADNPNLSGVPKAIVTSFLQPDEIAQAFRLGAVCLISKPSGFEAFMRDIGRKVAELLQGGATMNASSR